MSSYTDGDDPSTTHQRLRNLLRHRETQIRRLEVEALEILVKAQALRAKVGGAENNVIKTHIFKDDLYILQTTYLALHGSLSRMVRRFSYEVSANYAQHINTIFLLAASPPIV